MEITDYLAEWLQSPLCDESLKIVGFSQKDFINYYFKNFKVLEVKKAYYEYLEVIGHEPSEV